MVSRRRLFCTAAGLLGIAAVVRGSSTKQPRALIVTGGHDFDGEFNSLFEGGWCVPEHVNSNEDAFDRDLRGRYAVVVLYDMNQELSEQGSENLRRYLEAGGALVVMHHALVSYNSWRWWWSEVTGASYRMEDSPDLPASSYRHDTRMDFNVIEKHPVTDGVDGFSMIDETYGGMWYSDKITVLVESDSHQGRAPAIWLGPWPRSRVVCIQPGHDKVAFADKNYRMLVRQALLWAAGAV